jgi:hypothetical protein
MRFLVRDDKSGFYCTSSRKAALSKIEQTLRGGGKLPKTPGSPGQSEHGKILNWKKDLDRIVHRVLGSGGMTKSDKQLRSQPPSNNLETQVPDAAAFESSLPLRSSNADGRNKQERPRHAKAARRYPLSLAMRISRLLRSALFKRPGQDLVVTAFLGMHRKWILLLSSGLSDKLSRLEAKSPVNRRV